MTKLSVNINKLATLRNARGGNSPNLSEWVKKIESFGAHGITVHPRPDERHIKENDVYTLRSLISTEYNIEGYPDDRFLNLIETVKPHQCTLVPDPPHVLTSNAGWDMKTQKDILLKTIPHLSKFCRVSVFVEPGKLTLADAESLKKIGASRAEIYTEAFAKNYTDPQTLNTYISCAETLTQAGLELNAGHDLDLKNLNTLIKNIPQIKEVSIGHALICESLEFGMETVIKKYLSILGWR